MPTYYISNDSGDNDSGDGSLLLPWADWTFAAHDDQSNDGDTIVFLDGEFTDEGAGNHHSFDNGRIIKAQSYRGATIKAKPAESARAARTSGSLNEGDNPFEISNLIIDGDDGGANSVLQAFDFTVDASDDLVMRVVGCWFKSGTSKCLLNSMQRGEQEVIGCKISGNPSTYGLVLSNGGGAASQVFNIYDLEFDLSITDAGSTALNVSKVDNLTNTFDCKIIGVRGVIDVNTPAGTAIAFDVRGVDAPVVMGGDLTIDVNDSNAGMTGILVRGRATAQCTNPTVSGFDLKFNSPVGYGIMIGQSALAAYTLNGVTSGNRVTGKYYASATPHNYLIGQDVRNHLMRGNESIDSYVGYLISISGGVSGTATGGTSTSVTDTGLSLVADDHAGERIMNYTTGEIGFIKGNTATVLTTTIAFSTSDVYAIGICEIQGNIAYNCYGPSYYAKGVHGALIAGNIAVITGKHEQRGRCILSAVDQGSDDCEAVIFQENIIIVSNINTMIATGGLAQIGTDQVCKYIRNTYIIPDSVDLDTATLFKYKTTDHGDNANQTYAAWLANAEVTDDKIIQLPAVEVARIALKYKPFVADPVGDSGPIKTPVNFIEGV